MADLPIQSVYPNGSYFEAAPNAFRLLEQKLKPAEMNDDGLNQFIGMAMIIHMMAVSRKMK